MGTNKYPAVWWEPVDKETAAEWEILPQEAAPGEVILSKRNELGILSNFAPTPILFHGKSYASIEGFWQSLKFPENPQDPRNQPELIWPASRTQVEKLSGSEAKHMGDAASLNMKQIAINWVTYQGKKINYYEQGESDFYKLILEITWAKVQQNDAVKLVLLKTGNLILKPDHNQDLTVPLAWKYFDIYMKIRKELQSQ